MRVVGRRARRRRNSFVWFWGGKQAPPPGLWVGLGVCLCVVWVGGWDPVVCPPMHTAPHGHQRRRNKLTMHFLISPCLFWVVFGGWACGHSSARVVLGRFDVRARDAVGTVATEAVSRPSALLYLVYSLCKACLQLSSQAVKTCVSTPPPPPGVPFPLLPFCPWIGWPHHRAAPHRRIYHSFDRVFQDQGPWGHVMERAACPQKGRHDFPPVRV